MSPAFTKHEDQNLRMMHDARAVHDTASIRFREFRVGGRPGWVVARFHAAEESGSASVPGAYVNADTGQFVSPSGSAPVISKSGDWEPIATATGAVELNKVPYSWTEPMTDRRGPPVPEDYYSPFVKGGTAVFQYDPAQNGIDRFHFVRLIFQDWTQDVPSASEFIEAHKGLLENGEQRAPEMAQLHTLLQDKNRFLAGEAFRELAENGHLDGNVALDRLTRAAGPLDAVMVYLMVVSRDDRLLDQVNAAMRSTENQTKLQSIALGAFSALLLAGGAVNIFNKSKAVLQQINSRIQELKLQPQEDSYLYPMLNRAGVR